MSVCRFIELPVSRHAGRICAFQPPYLSLSRGWQGVPARPGVRVPPHR